MNREPLLLLTHDDALARRWEPLGDEWTAARGRGLEALQDWRAQGRRLVLMDGALPGLPQWTDTQWPARFSTAAVLVGLGQPDDPQGTATLQAGAAGFCHVYAPLETLRQALRVVAAGELWVGRALLSRLLQRFQEIPPPAGGVSWHVGLTEREREVAELAAIGEANDAIASQLGITPRTVKAHLSSVFEKLAVADRLQLALRVHGIR